MNWLRWKIDWFATPRAHLGGPRSTPSAAAVRARCRASYESTHSAASCSTKSRECGAQSRVRSPTAARRSGRPTGAARRRACPATFIDTGRDNSGRGPGVRRTRRTNKRDASQHRPKRGPVADPPSTIARAWQRSSRRHRPSTRLRPSGSTGRRGRRGDRRPLLALGAIVVGAFVLYALLATGVDGPRVHPDEVRYMMAASSLVEGEGLTLRGQRLRVRPALPARARRDHARRGKRRRGVRLVQGRERVLLRTDGRARVPPRPPARLPLVGGSRGRLCQSRFPRPSRGTVMTESLSYLTTVWALYAIAVALERPSVFRQLAVLGAVAAAVLTRTQFGILYVTWVGALASSGCSHHGRRPRTRAELVRFWPTALPLVLGDARVRRTARLGSSAQRHVRRVWVLWRGYDPFEVGNGSSTTSGTSPSTSWSCRLPSRRSCSGSSRAPVGRDRGGRRVRRAVRRGERHGAARRRRVREQPVGLRPAPRPLRVLSRAAVARGPRGGGSPPAFLGRSSRPRSERSPRSRSCSSCRSHSSRTRRGSTPFPARSGCGSRRSSRGPGPASGRLALGIFVVGSSRRRFSCRGASPASPCRSR